MLLRKPIQARAEFDIRGITNEVTWTDYLSQTSGDSNDDGEDGLRLDRAQFISGRHDTMALDPTEEADMLNDADTLGILASQSADPESDASGLAETRHDQLVKALAEASVVLTDRQAIALWLWTTGWSETAAADYMWISQPAFHEIIHGKKGVGGALRKISKYFQKHPIG
jgi:hypothetical protein